MMRKIRRILTAAALFAGAISFTACEVEQTEEGEAPEVSVEGGELPQYDVDTAEVDVDTERRRVDVPEVDVDTRRETAEVPTVDVRGPGEGEG